MRQPRQATCGPQTCVVIVLGFFFFFLTEDFYSKIEI